MPQNNRIIPPSPSAAQIRPRLVALVLAIGAVRAAAATVNWNVAQLYGMNQPGLSAAIRAAGERFARHPLDTVILELAPGSFYLEAPAGAAATIDLSGISPGPDGRLVIKGAGMNRTILIFDEARDAIFGRNAAHITFSGMEMTRRGYTVSQGHVVDVAPGKIVLEIQTGFPSPDAIFNPKSRTGRYLRRYTDSRTDPQLVTEDNDQVPWQRARPLGGARWEFTLTRKHQVAGYPAGALIGIKSKHGGQAYRFLGGTDIFFDGVKWTQESRGVFRNGCDHVHFRNCVIARAPAIDGQTPCLATPDGGPQIGQPQDQPTGANLVESCRFEACGDDAIAFFNATGTVRDCYVSDAFGAGILLANSRSVALRDNTLVRCSVIRNRHIRGMPPPAP